VSLPVWSVQAMSVVLPIAGNFPSSVAALAAAIAAGPGVFALREKRLAAPRTIQRLTDAQPSPGHARTDTRRARAQQDPVGAVFAQVLVRLRGVVRHHGQPAFWDALAYRPAQLVGDVDEVDMLQALPLAMDLVGDLGDDDAGFRLDDGARLLEVGLNRCETSSPFTGSAAAA